MFIATLSEIHIILIGKMLSRKDFLKFSRFMAQPSVVLQSPVISLTSLIRVFPTRSKPLSPHLSNPGHNVAVYGS